MDKITVAHIAVNEGDLNYFTLENLMRGLPWQEIATVNWPDEYPEKPNVRFQIAHCNNALLLHYHVQENFVKAQYIRPNEPVYEDSCVEFFISFDNKQQYYNLEFNALGTGLIGYGPQTKALRNRLPAEAIEKVLTTSMVQNSQGNKTWDMILVIPVDLFTAHPITDLAGLSAHANFYKCGDGLPTPHFVSWAPIDAEKPNFHLPEFFGELYFE